VWPKPDHLRRYRDLATLLMKYGRSDLLASAGLDAEELLADPAQEPPAEDDTGPRLARDLEKRGPTFVKMGQLLSSRPDIVAPPVAEALGRLQNDVEPFPFADVERIVASELGVRLSKAFASFDPRPIAAASLGQVHRAALRDGREVAVKVQRPGIREQVAGDLELLAGIAQLVDSHVDAAQTFDAREIAAEFRRVLTQELDYRREAQNQVLLGRVLAEYTRILVPQPIEDYTTSRVLTMDFVRGYKITSLSPIVRMDAGGPALADELIRAYLHQFIVEGFFHADPHPGNVFLTDDARLALIDLGMVSQLQERTQEHLLRLLLAVAAGDGAEAADVVIRMAERRADADEAGYRKTIAALIAGHRAATLGDLRAGRTLIALAQIAARHGIRLPQEMALLGKTVLNLEEIARILAPEFTIADVVRDHSTDLMRRRMVKSLSPAHLFASTMEMRDLAQRLPGRLNRLLDRLTDDEVKVKVEMIDDGAVIEGLQKVANRITLGLLLAAVIVAAGMLMRVPTTFTVFGYPGLAMIFFLAAATGAALLAFNIITHDRAPRP